ncbi:hypothetical protein Q7P37_003382 [Cladosporium fusiforme]
MPPKLRIKISSPATSTPATPSTAATNGQRPEQREYLLTNGALVEVDSSPLPPKKKQRKAKSSPKDVDDKKKVDSQIPSPDATGDDYGAGAKQGMTAPPKKAAARKRKFAETENGNAPASKRKKAAGKPKKSPETVVESDEDNVTLDDEVRKAAASKPKTTPKKTPKKTPKIVADSDGDNATLDDDTMLDPSNFSSPPLSNAVKQKIQSIQTFLSTHTESLSSHGGGNNIQKVDELDILAALTILCVDYQLDIATDTISLDAAVEMITTGYGANSMSVDFGRSCDIGRMVQDKIKSEQEARGFTGLNLVKIEVEMLRAHRKRLACDGMPAAGFRVYGS